MVVRHMVMEPLRGQHKVVSVCSSNPAVPGSDLWTIAKYFTLKINMCSKTLRVTLLEPFVDQCLSNNSWPC